MQSKIVPNLQQSIGDILSGLKTSYQNLDAIGKPIVFSSGQYENRTIRVELEEIQKADVGRKFFKKDRRPLDPPPTVKLRIFERFLPPDQSDPREEEILDLDTTYPEGWICHVELFRAPGSSTEIASSSAGPLVSMPEREDGVVSEEIDGHQPMVAIPIQAQSAEISVGVQSTQSFAAPIGTPNGSTKSSVLYELPLVQAPAERDSPEPSLDLPEPILQRLDDDELGENLTSQLAGSTFVHAIQMKVEGQDRFIFTFTDLSSKLEGIFMLRYRCFNVLCTAVGDSPLPVMAQCVGGPFQVYSTKTFPGLSESTHFTKSLAEAGIRTNKRETVRKGGTKTKDGRK